MIAGCTDNREKETEDKIIHVLEDSLEELLTTSTNTKYGSNVERLRVVDVNVLEKSCFVTFLLKKTV